MRLAILLLLVLADASLAFAFVQQQRKKLVRSPRPYSTRGLFSAASSSSNLDEGLLKTISKEGQGEALRLGDIATIKYSCYLPDNPNSSSSSSSSSPFAKSSRQKIVVGDGSFIDGWEKSIRSMRVGERSIVRITDPSLGYGEPGVPPIIPPNAVIEMDLEILDAQPAAANIDFDSIAMADSTPRTAKDIAAAFEARQAAKSLEPKKEGLEAFLAKAKNFYFFGLFEGETGERPPWFLRPSITFPLAFLIVGAAFYISFVGGAISERGAQVKDELDEIVVSMNSLGPSSSSFVAVTTAILFANAVDLTGF